MNCEIMLAQIRNGLCKYFDKYPNIRCLVLGVSGGIDSALSAAIARPICDQYNIKLVGRSIPIKTNKIDEIRRADLIGNALCNDFKMVDLTNHYEILQSAINIANNEELSDIIFDIEMRDKIRAGNLKARMRMILLYDLARKYNGVVLSSDNYTELMLGFFSINGDVGDLGMIQYLWKTEVYQLANYIADKTNDKKVQTALLECIDAVPTDGLGVSNSDLDQLGASSYAEVDKLLQEYLDTNVILNNFLDKLNTSKPGLYQRLENRIKELKNHPVIQRHLRSEFKRHLPYNIERKYS
jgi:NAD+ synthase